MTSIKKRKKQVLRKAILSMLKLFERGLGFIMYLLTYEDKKGNYNLMEAINKTINRRKTYKKRNFPQFSTEIQQQINQIKEIEVEVIKKLSEKTPIYSLPYPKSFRLRLLKKVLKEIDRYYPFFFIFSSLRRGGSELEAINIIKSILQHSTNDLLIIYTDQLSPEAEDWLPKEKKLQVINFHELDAEASFEERQDVLAHLISSHQPKYTINTNSAVGWEVYEKWGKALRKNTKLDALLFCYDYDKSWNKAGYVVDYFRNTIPYLNKVILDNEAFKEELIKDFGLTKSLSDKIIAVKQPYKNYLKTIKSDKLIANITLTKENKPHILWASRLAEQKRPKLLIEIAKLLPNYDFHVYGYGDLSSFSTNNKISKNIIYKGAYKDFTEIPYEKATAFLYTSSYDGMPNVVIDVLKMGLPIVTSNVGGIGELVTMKNGWLIDNSAGAEAYVAALKEIHNHPNLVEEKLANAKVSLNTIHSQDKFNEVVRKELNYY